MAGVDEVGRGAWLAAVHLKPACAGVAVPWSSRGKGVSARGARQPSEDLGTAHWQKQPPDSVSWRRQVVGVALIDRAPKAFVGDCVEACRRAARLQAQRVLKLGQNITAVNGQVDDGVLEPRDDRVDTGSASCTHGGERRAGPGGERARGERTERSDASVVVVPNRANERAGERLHSAAGAAA